LPWQSLDGYASARVGEVFTGAVNLSPEMYVDALKGSPMGFVVLLGEQGGLSRPVQAGDTVLPCGSRLLLEYEAPGFSAMAAMLREGLVRIEYWLG
jgi:hypothetical protein